MTDHQYVKAKISLAPDRLTLVVSAPPFVHGFRHWFISGGHSGL